jgi:hypothetical protein
MLFCRGEDFAPAAEAASRLAVSLVKFDREFGT